MKVLGFPDKRCQQMGIDLTATGQKTVLRASYSQILEAYCLSYALAWSWFPHRIGAFSAIPPTAEVVSAACKSAIAIRPPAAAKVASRPGVASVSVRPPTAPEIVPCPGESAIPIGAPTAAEIIACPRVAAVAIRAPSATEVVACSRVAAAIGSPSSSEIVAGSLV